MHFQVLSSICEDIDRHLEGAGYSCDFFTFNHVFEDYSHAFINKHLIRLEKPDCPPVYLPVDAITAVRLCS